MAVPDGLLIAGALVGLVGGAVGIASGVDNLVTRVRKGRKEKLDAEVKLSVDWGTYDHHDGPQGANFPVALGKLSNHGKVPVRDVEVTASTGWAEAYFTEQGIGYRLQKVPVKELPPDQDAWLEVAMVKVHEADGGFRSSVAPYVVGVVELTVTWRIEGSSERSKPLKLSHDYDDSLPRA